MPKKRIYIPRNRKRVPQKGQIRFSPLDFTKSEIWNGKLWKRINIKSISKE